MNDDFEKRLQRVAPREIPSAWRSEILTAAQSAEISRHPSPAAHPGFLSTLIRQLSTFTRPQRAAWSGLAAAWAVILTLNLAARDGAPTSTARETTPSPEAIAAWRQQRRELAGLAELTHPRPTEALRTIPPQPRSHRREDCSNA